MNKAILPAASAILAASFMSASCSAQGADYKNSSWSDQIISRYVQSGIGTSAENIKDYTKNITRLGFAGIVYDYLNHYGYITSGSESKVFFDDVDSPIPGVLANLGIIRGKSETEFAPDSFITREEAAEILYNICKLTEIEDVYETRLLSSYMYIDEKDMSDSAVDAIYNITFHGIMNGMGEDKFSPKENLTAEQAVAAAARLFDIVPKKGNGEFADLLNYYADSNSNYMFSPLSAKMALALAANGASGETRDEIIKAVGIDNLNEFNAKSEKLIEKYSKSDIIKLNISNSVWINNSNNDMSFSEGYKKLISEYYKASAEAVTNDNALSRINGWVKESTNEKIDSIIDSPDFDSVLINAIYFKGTWLNRFEKNATQKDVFNERNGDKTETDFMNTTAHFNNAYTDNVRIIELPYTNRSDIFDNKGNYVRTETLDGADISMYILMPDSDTAINPCELISKCKSKNLLSSSNINLSMPKFKIEYSKNLNDVLKTAGINKAFTGQAEFSPMFDKGSMYIDKVLQKTYIDVDENGTEAAAVTAVIMECTSAMPDEPEKLCLDRPFTFVIMDNTENEALFIGEYAYVE